LSEPPQPAAIATSRASRGRQSRIGIEANDRGAF
jgi:hypothetical protein